MKTVDFIQDLEEGMFFWTRGICDASFASDMPRSLVFRETRCQENFQSFKQKQKCSWT